MTGGWSKELFRKGGASIQKLRHPLGRFEQRQPLHQNNYAKPSQTIMRVIPMPIRDLARTDVVTGNKDTSTAELARRMDDEQVGSVVITEDNRPVGIVTDRDLAMFVVGPERDLTAVTASDVMSETLCMIDGSSGLTEAMDLMSEHGIRRLPVCENGDELVGIITIDDLIELLGDEHNRVSNVVQNQRPAY
jgi:CBS domain-containing protein